MKNLARLLFICLFTLLQCVAPLAHAHIDGDQSNEGLHAVEFEHALWNLDLSRSTASTPESPAIGMPHELPRDTSLELALAPPRAQPQLPPAAARPCATMATLPLASTPGPGPFETPLSHAPPALA
jgi:hypothetical protein